jgi:hypothetical protein
VDRRHPRHLGGAHVGDRIVGEQQFGGRPPAPFEQDFEDARIGLGDAGLARNDADVEFVEEAATAFEKSTAMSECVTKSMPQASPRRRSSCASSPNILRRRLRRSQRNGTLPMSKTTIKGLAVLGKGAEGYARVAAPTQAADGIGCDVLR